MRDIKHDFEANTQSVYVNIDEASTQILLRSLPKISNYSIQTILLSTLTLAYQEWANQKGLYVNIDSHGREDLFNDISLVKTVGWFTSLRPAYLRADITNIALTLDTISNTLQYPKHKGINFGLLKYLHQGKPSSNIPNAEIGFNYFGQYFQNFSDESLFNIATESCGQYRSKQNQRIYQIK